ncbi:MAG: DNA-binding response regulator [Xanthomonadales bacterium]|nr:DNA-binding response regulator [Xanthomonadales bacterium]
MDTSVTGLATHHQRRVGNPQAGLWGVGHRPGGRETKRRRRVRDRQHLAIHKCDDSRVSIGRPLDVRMLSFLACRPRCGGRHADRAALVAARHCTRSRMLRTVLLEDDPQARRLLRTALSQSSPQPVDVREAETVAACRALLDAAPCDLLLADLCLPDGSGIEAIRHATTLSPRPTVLVVSSLADEEIVVEAIATGASGYVSKLDAPEEITRAIDIAFAGGSCISPTIAQRLMELVRRQGNTPATKSASHAQLTEAERSVLQLAAQGHTYRHIAQINGIQPSTVYTHVRHIYEKLQVSNLAQALYQARRQHLV